MLDLEKIRKRWSEVTPPPWRRGYSPPETVARAVKGGTTILALGDMEFHVACGLDSDDAEAIAAAPTDIADLIAEVERLRADVVRLRRESNAVILDGGMQGGEPY